LTIIIIIETEIKILHMYLMCSVNYVSTTVPKKTHSHHRWKTHHFFLVNSVTSVFIHKTTLKTASQSLWLHFKCQQCLTHCLSTLEALLTINCSVRCWSHQFMMSWVCNETDTQLIIFKYKKNTMKRKRRALYRSKKIMCFNLKVLVSN